MRLSALVSPLLFAATVLSTQCNEPKTTYSPEGVARNSIWGDIKPAIDSLRTVCEKFTQHGKWHKGDYELQCVPYFDEVKDEWRAWVFDIERIKSALPWLKKLKTSRCQKYLKKTVMNCPGYGGSVKAKKFRFQTNPGQYSMPNKTFVSTWLNGGGDPCMGVQSYQEHPV